MNKDRRKIIADLADRLSFLLDEVQEVVEAEEDYYNNVPENLQGSDRFSESEEAISSLNDATSSIDEAIEALNNAGGEG